MLIDKRGNQEIADEVIGVVEVGDGVLVVVLGPDVVELEGEDWFYDDDDNKD